MSNNDGGDQRSSALYQYAVPAAVFILAAVSITIYFRSSIRRQPPPGARAVVALRGGRERAQFDPGMKPPLFEAYLTESDGPGQQHQWDTEAQAPVPSREWAEIMPLSVADVVTGTEGLAARAAKRASAASPSPPLPPDAHSRAEVDPRPPDANLNSSSLRLNSDPTRVLVSVIVRMPVAPESAPTVEGDSARDEEDGAPLPYLELGLVEVDVLHAEDSAQAIT